MSMRFHAGVVVLAVAAASFISIASTVTAGAAAPTAGAGAGYWFVAGDGGVFSFGPAAPFQGSAGAIHLAQPIVGMAATPDGGGYWLVARDGGVFTYGNARYYGSTGGQPLSAPIVGMAATEDGGGYWMVTADGHLYGFGDTDGLGANDRPDKDSPAVSAIGPISAPVVAIASNHNGGVLILCADGRVLGPGAMGDADFDGAPAVAIVPSVDGQGYWVASNDGQIEAFGDAPKLPDPRTTLTVPLNAPIVGMAATPDGQGYYELGRDGGVFSFGDAHFFGSTGNLTLNSPVLGLAVANRPAVGADIHLGVPPNDPNDVAGGVSGAVVVVHPGDTVTVDLDGPEWMGEAWRTATGADPSVVTSSEKDIAPPSDGGTNIRSDTDQQFTYQAVADGHVSVTLQLDGLEPPFAPVPAPDGGTFTFGITVAG